jgi:alpha 1,2-mannosyltransferase
MLKPLCIIKSSFKEVLFMDADNICVKDPTELFETAEYLEYGAVFWPDFWQTPADNPIWAITETPYIASKEQESGQLLINKERVWKELNLSLHFNELSNIYHRLLMGDKDTFRFAWLALKTPFFMTPEEPAVCGYPDSNNTFLGTTMIQHDRKGDFYFLHRNLLKWDVTRIGEKVWTSIKKFSPQTPGKEYIFSVSANGHCYMDLVGKVNVTDFSIVFPGFEEICMEYLEGLRSSGFYHRFLTYSHFAAHRYPKETLFSLDSPL